MHLTNQRHPRLHLSLKNNSPAEMDRGAGDHGGGPGCAEGAHHGLVETEGCILIDGLRSIGCSTKADPRTWHRHRPRRGAPVLASVSLAVTSLYTLHCYILGCKLAEQPVARSVAAMEYVSVCIHGHFARSDLYFSPTDNNQKNQNRWKIKLALGYVFLWHLLPFTAYIIHSQVRHKAFMSSESLLPSPKRTAVYTDNTSPPPHITHHTPLDHHRSPCAPRTSKPSSTRSPPAPRGSGSPTLLRPSSSTSP